MQQKSLTPVLTIVGLAAILFLSVGLAVRPYHWNVTALFHMDRVIGDQNGLPAGFIVLSEPSYDGAQYYQIARNIPKILSPSRWTELRTKAPGSYAYQRFLLPLSAYASSLGQEPLLPYAFLFVNLASLLLCCAIVLRWKHGKPLYALALCLSPAALVALHFSLAEPLTLLLTTLVLIRFHESQRLRAMDILCLSLTVLTREVNMLLVLYLIGFSLIRRHGREALLLCIPVAVFLGWHAVIYAVFGNIPFLMSAQAHQFPGLAALQVVLGERGYDRYTLSAAALFLGLVLPGILWTGGEIAVRRRFDVLSLGAFLFLAVMLTMPDYIWGSITSIGRVITPVYPLLLLACSMRDSRGARFLGAMTLLIGLAAGLGLALAPHPFTLAP